jgi:hypothetical protein
MSRSSSGAFSFFAVTFVSSHICRDISCFKSNSSTGAKSYVLQGIGYLVIYSRDLFLFKIPTPGALRAASLGKHRCCAYFHVLSRARNCSHF